MSTKLTELTTPPNYMMIDSTLAKTSMVVADPDQVSADFGEGAVILDLKEGIYYELNEVGTRIWSLIQQPCPVQVILETLLEEYEVSAPQCEADLLALLQDMAAKGLVEIRNGANQ